MGTQEEEAKAQAELERVRTENAIKAMQRDEDLRKLREQQGNMVATDPQQTGQGWPDNEVQAAPGRLAQAAGKVGLGPAADAELAKRLLNDGQPAPGSRQTSGDTGKSAADTAGARAKAGSLRGVKPALEH